MPDPPGTMRTPLWGVNCFTGKVDLSKKGWRVASIDISTTPPMRKPTDRAAIFTMSGTPWLDFTDDQERLRDALMRLRPNIMTRAGAMSGGDTLTYGSLDAIKNVVQSLAAMPGQRTMMMVSPGFFTNDPMF